MDRSVLRFTSTNVENEMEGNSLARSRQSAAAETFPHWRNWLLEGRFLYALAGAMLAVIWLASGDFINVWQPVADIPARMLVVRACGVALLLSSAGLLIRRSAAIAAVVPTLLYALFVWGWITRIMLLPRVFGTWSGCAEEVALVIAGVLLAAARPTEPLPHHLVTASRILFGLCALSFGIIHFDALEPTAKMVPTWIPGSGTFWATATGVGHIAGGLALIANFRARLAAQLLATMYMAFELLIWVPAVWATPGDPIAWGGNAITIAIAASALVLGDAVARSGRDAPVRVDPRGLPAT